MSVAALPPPSLQPRMPIPTQKRPVMQPRPSTSAAVAPRTSQVKSKPTSPPALVRRPSSASSVTPLGTPVALPAPTAGSSKDTSSSSGKVFAKPSKEWVLPERAKPGRKVSVEEPDNVSRQSDPTDARNGKAKIGYPNELTAPGGQTISKRSRSGCGSTKRTRFIRMSDYKKSPVLSRRTTSDSNRRSSPSAWTSARRRRIATLGMQSGQATSSS